MAAQFRTVQFAVMPSQKLAYLRARTWTRSHWVRDRGWFCHGFLSGPSGPVKSALGWSEAQQPLYAAGFEDSQLPPFDLKSRHDPHCPVKYCPTTSWGVPFGPLTLALAALVNSAVISFLCAAVPNLPQAGRTKCPRSVALSANWHAQISADSSSSVRAANKTLERTG